MDAFAPQFIDPSPLAAERLDAGGYQSALANAQKELAVPEMAPLDAVIHGVAVRLYTNNAHWRRFWAANWFAPDQWASLVGGSRPSEPRIAVYATVGETGSAPWAGYSITHNTAFLSGDVSHGPLRALALGAVAFLLADEQAVHHVPGAVVEQDGQGALLLPGSGVDSVDDVVELMENDDSHMLAFDGAFVRYGMVRMVDGVTLLPTMLYDESGLATRGYRLFPWLDEYGFDEPRADVRCITVARDEVYCFARDLDLGRAPDALAFPLEQAWYVPTQIVSSNANLVRALWHAALEGVPGLTPELWHEYGEWSQEAVRDLATDAPMPVRSFVAEVGAEAVAEALVRLRATPYARAMVPPEQLWPGRVGGHPWHPTRIVRVAHLDGSAQPGTVAAALRGDLACARSVLADLWEDEIEAALAENLVRAIAGN